ncbi:uncharacterized protein LOC134738259 isoform X2 [Pongo pygmaeus]|uniref:uncharacterized protein LOC134738259 isoform X2 n=1 Tax=Pongo pygmaeus TaxID=9600 RepID=UPI00300C8B34
MEALQSPVVAVAWHPWFTQCWWMAQDEAVAVGGVVTAGRKMLDSSEQRRPHGVLDSVWPGIHGALCAGEWLRTEQLPSEARCLLEGRWSLLPNHKGPAESWSRCGLASRVHLVLVVTQDAVAVGGPLPAVKEDGRGF